MYFMRKTLATLCFSCLAASVPAEVLGPGQSLQAGQQIYSNNMKYVAVMQADGNFVVYRNDGSGHAVWSSNTTGLGGNQVSMQADGNMVMYTGAGHPVWSTNTNGQNRYFTVDGNGKAMVLTVIPTWASNTYDGTNPVDTTPVIFPANTSIPQGQVFTQAGGKYALSFQKDGNFVIYKNGAPIWSTGTWGVDNANFTAQINIWLSTDGMKWQSRNWSNTYGYSKSQIMYNSGYLSFQPNGDLVSYAPVLLWKASQDDYAYNNPGGNAPGGDGPACVGDPNACIPWTVPIKFPF